MTVDKSKYIVLDLETNGLTVDDDILSISLYKPDDETMYSKFLPLERAKLIKTTRINGITVTDLKGARELTQQDVYEIIERFELEKRIILTYSNFDEKMLRNYFKRKRLKGFECFNFYNFKTDVISSKYSEGNITKDNLCNLYGISNVQEIHSSSNDCILEWKLFEKMDGKALFITNNKVFEMNNEYIVPISYFCSHPNLKKYVTNFPYINIESHLVKRFEFSGVGIKRFESNLNGLIIEHLIDSLLQVDKQESRPFLVKNKGKLKYLGKLPSEILEIPLYFKEDGIVEKVNEKDRQMADVLNAVLCTLKSQIAPLIEFIAKEIFHNEKIMSQELVVYEKENILSLCDLSSSNTVMEIKTNYRADLYEYREQLYFEANGRDCYVLQVNWSGLPAVFAVEIHQVDVTVGEAPEKERSHKKRVERFKNKISNDNLEVVSYYDTSSNVTLKCKVCEYEWETTYYTATHSAKCPFCEPKEVKRKEKLSIENREQLRAAQYTYKILQKSNGCISASNFKGAKEKVDAVCLQCGYKWYIRADHLQERLYCPDCRVHKK